METLLTNTGYNDLLINLDNVLYIERYKNNSSIIYFVDGSSRRFVDNFDALVEELHNNG